MDKRTKKNIIKLKKHLKKIEVDKTSDKNGKKDEKDK